MTPRGPSVWTPDAIAVLEKGKREGLSGTQIAQAIYDATRLRFTRNAVIGKAHRLGLVMHGTNKPVRRKAPVPRRDGHSPEHNSSPAGREPASSRGSAEGNPPGSSPEGREPASSRGSAGENQKLAPTIEKACITMLPATACRWAYGPALPYDWCGRRRGGSSFYCETHHEAGTGQGTPSERAAALVRAT